MIQTNTLELHRTVLWLKRWSIGLKSFSPLQLSWVINGWKSKQTEPEPMSLPGGAGRLSETGRGCKAWGRFAGLNLFVEVTAGDGGALGLSFCISCLSPFRSDWRRLSLSRSLSKVLDWTLVLVLVLVKGDLTLEIEGFDLNGVGRFTLTLPENMI